MRTPTIRFALILVLAGAFSSTAHGQFNPGAKDVAAPPSDIVNGRVVLPSASETGSSSPVQIRALAPTWDAARGWTAEIAFDVDADGPLSLALLMPQFVTFAWEFVRPSGATIDAAELRRMAQHDARENAFEDSTWSADRWDLSAAARGAWRVRITAPGLASTEPPPSGWLVARTAGRARLVAHASTLETRSDMHVGIVARFEDAQVLSDLHGRAVVQLATGSIALDLADDGLHADGAAGDGTFGAYLPAWTSGDVLARVDLVGTAQDGGTIARTANLAFPMIERRAALTGRVETDFDEFDRVRIELAVLPLGPPARLLVASEVWGTNQDGELVPVAWLARMQAARTARGADRVALALDRRWIERAGAGAPFVLRHVRLQDPDTCVPHDLAAEIALDMPPLPPAQAARPIPVTPSMLQGPGISATRAGPHTAGTPILIQPAVLLVHGYCSGGSIWPAADFSQPKQEFLDPNANRSHDQFAQLMLQATSSLSSFGVVAHSQGGMAALHLYTYYASGLDTATGPRLIQSLCSPYLGTPLASLGFFACGVNSNMTPSGSTTWLAGIPTWARAQVFYWTTQNSGSACNGLVNLFLSSPNDGTVEMFRGQLVGGNSLGHLLGWCHTTGMSNPASYTDHVRNAERDAQAAR